MPEPFERSAESKRESERNTEPLPESERFSTTCPMDGTVIEADDLILHFLFPSDGDAVIDVLTQRLNARRCTVCSTVVQIVVPLFAFNMLSKRGVFVAASIPQDKLSVQLKQLGIPSDRLDIVHNYDELRLAMLPWLADYLSESLLLVFTGELALIERKERFKYLESLRLRLLRLAADGVLTISLSLPEDSLGKIKTATGKDDATEAVREFLPRQLAGAVYGLLIDLSDEAVEAKNLQGLYAEVERRLPSDAVSDLALKMFLEECQPLSELVKQGKGFKDAYRHQMLNAMVHARMGQPNPQSKGWAQYLKLAWQLSQQQPEAFQRSLLPSAELAPRFTRFEDLWGVSAGVLASGGDRGDIESRFNGLAAMMRDLGFEERLTKTLVGGAFRFQIRTPDETPEGQDKKIDALVKAMHDIFSREFSFDISIEKSLTIGDVAGPVLRNLAMSGVTRGAAELAESLINDAVEAEDFVAAFTIGCRAIAELNGAQAWDQAAAIAEPLTKKFNQPQVSKQLERAGARLTVEFFNEVGNTFRYLHNYEPALSSYETARAFLSLVDDEDGRRFCEGVIAANEGRVYRQQGLYGIALERLTHQAITQPDDAEAHHGLAILNIEINRWEDALLAINHAIAATEALVRSRDRANLLITRAVIHARCGRANEAAADLHAADRLAPSDAEIFRLRIAAATGFWLGKAKVEGELLKSAEGRLWSIIRDSSPTTQPSLLATAFGALGTLLLDQGRVEDARRLDSDYLEPFLSERDRGEWPWQLLHLKGRIERELGNNDESWPWFRAVLDVLEADIPSKEDAAFSMTWLADKDAFQSEFSDLTINRVVQRTINPLELLRAYEFANGRTLGARLARENATDLAAIVPERLAIAAQTRGCKIVVFLFVDGSEAVHIVRLTSNDPMPRLVDGGVLPLERVRKVAQRFISAMAYANPAALDSLDRELEPWRSLSEEIGRLLADQIPHNSMVCFLPGRNLTALPLHLVWLPAGQSVIEQSPVIYAPNLTLLLDDHVATTKSGSISLVVTVAKANDTKDFRDRLHSEGKRLLRYIEETGRSGHLLDGTDATRAAVVRALANSEEVFFLCHGTHGGRTKGYGICLSDGRRLPPPLLPVDDAPDLARFVLGWDDLEALTSLPRLVVSVACSSGRVVVAPGGVRLGLEQTLFAGGTRTILSPLWDVDQEASVAWVDAFESARRSNPAAPLADAYRASCRAMRQMFNHPYFWGPFVLSGSLFGEHHA